MSETTLETGGLQRPKAASRTTLPLRIGGWAYHGAFGLLILIVALSPLPLASNRPAFWGMLGALTGLASMLWAIAAILAPSRANPVPFSEIRLPAALFGIAALWAFVQTLPLAPEGLAHPLWAETAGLLGEDVRSGYSISINPYVTAEALFRMLSYGLVFWLALQFSAVEHLARILFWSIAASVTVYALYGLGAHLSGSNSILWMEKWAYEGRLTGPFVNANSFATYLGMGLIAVAALLFRQFARVMDDRLPFRQRILQFVEYTFGRGAFLATCALLLAAALALTASRAGLAATLLGLLIMLQVRRDGGGIRSLIGPGIIGFVLLIGVSLSGETLAKRAEDTIDNSNVRWNVYVVTARMIASSPILGTGHGTFEDAFTAYRDVTVGATHTWDKAHNSYLETLLGLGIPVGLCLITAVVLLGWRCYRGARSRRRHKLYPAVAAGIAALVGAHALVDFSVQMPAVAATFAAVLGLGVAQSKSARERG